MRVLLLALLLGACASADPTPEPPQPAAPQHQTMPCAARAAALGSLRERYREARAGYGTTLTGALAELHSSTGGETWTLTVTMPNGLTCLVVAGRAWRSELRQGGEGT